MTYIILRDTFGDGLETISNIGVDVIDEHQLDKYICAAAEIILQIAVPYFPNQGILAKANWMKKRISMNDFEVVAER